MEVFKKTSDGGRTRLRGDSEPYTRFMVLDAKEGGILVYDGMYDNKYKLEIFPEGDVEQLILSEEEIRTEKIKRDELVRQQPEGYPYRGTCRVVEVRAQMGAFKNQWRPRHRPKLRRIDCQQQWCEATNTCRCYRRCVDTPRWCICTLMPMELRQHHPLIFSLFTIYSRKFA